MNIYHIINNLLVETKRNETYKYYIINKRKKVDILNKKNKIRSRCLFIYFIYVYIILYFEYMRSKLSTQAKLKLMISIYILFSR